MITRPVNQVVSTSKEVLKHKKCSKPVERSLFGFYSCPHCRALVSILKCEWVKEDIS